MACFLFSCGIKTVNPMNHNSRYPDGSGGTMREGCCSTAGIVKGRKTMLDHCCKKAKSQNLHSLACGVIKREEGIQYEEKDTCVSYGCSYGHIP